MSEKTESGFVASTGPFALDIGEGTMINALTVSETYTAVAIDVQREGEFVPRPDPGPGNYLLVITAPDAYFAVGFDGVVTGDPAAAKASIDAEIERRGILEANAGRPEKLGYLLLARELCARYAAPAPRGFA